MELSAAIATASAPDLIIASQENLLALQKFVTPLPPSTLPASTFTNTFINGASVFGSSKGYYGVPFLVDPLVLFYNRSILASSGIAKPPATWEALTGLVPSIATLTPARQITRSFIALGTYQNVTNARGILSSLFLQTGVPLSSYLSTGALAANLGILVQNGSIPGQAVVSFYTQFADPSKVSYTWNASMQESKKAFLSGDLALYLGYASEARVLSAANPNLNFAVAPLPQPATASTKNAYGLIYAFIIPRGSPNVTGAYQVASVLSGPVQQAVVAPATGLAPANLNALTEVPDDPTAAIAYSEALYTKGWLSPAPSDTDAVFSGMITNVITGRSSLETALPAAERALTALLQQ
jgi:ABC-type glycerol-3-phosphate transport system substrate-binding protein